jgi:hypothetical protein
VHRRRKTWYEHSGKIGIFETNNSSVGLVALRSRQGLLSFTMCWLRNTDILEKFNFLTNKFFSPLKFLKGFDRPAKQRVGELKLEQDKQTLNYDDFV